MQNDFLKKWDLYKKPFNNRAKFHFKISSFEL